MTPNICIIILNWNGYNITRDCLISLKKITYPTYSVIIVDNGSNDHSIENLSEEFNHVDYLQLDKNFGFTGGNNQGIVYAVEKYNPDYLLLLNNDTEVKSDFLDKLISPFLKDDNIFATVPKIYYFDNKDTIWYAGGEISRLTGIVTEYGKGQKDSYSTSFQRSIGFMNGCAVLLSAKTIQEIGLLDERFFAYSEDTDYSLRILKSGHTIVFVPESVVYHKVSFSFRTKSGNGLKYYLATRNIVLLQRKHRDALFFTLFVFVFLFRWVLYISLKLIITKEYRSVKSVLSGFYDGLSGRSRYGL